jgi:Fis family transcriptional regulator
MNTTSPDRSAEAGVTSPRLSASDCADPLSKCVRDSLRFYIENMGGHEVTNLYALVMEEVERPMFETVLRHTNGNLSHAAKMLGMTRATLRKRLGQHGIERGR